MTSPSIAGGSPATMTPTLVVVVVAESRARARVLRQLLSGPGFSVAAEVCTAAAAEAAVVAHEPGAVLLDLHPESGGIEAIERIMGTRPTPVVVCGDLVPHSHDALAAGAVDVIGALDALPSSPQYASAVRRHLKVASRMRVITHPRNRLRVRGLSPEPAAVSAGPAGPAGPAVSAVSAVQGAIPDYRRSEPPVPEPPTSRVQVVVIGASTGGPPALATILAELPPGLPVPVLVIQHMADGFVESLASWLDGVSPLPVAMAQHGRRLAPGTVYVAPAGVNTMLRQGLLIELRTPAPGQFHIPGVDAAFASAASACGATAVGVLLTGMGRDGAAGLRKLRDRGALTIGQDEPTSVVWGMPAAAQALGAVEVELSLPAIGPAIAAAVRDRTCTAWPVTRTAGG